MARSPSLSDERLNRFARQIVLPEVGGAGQVALAGKHVALVGLGGIGSPALQYLTAAGIGKLTLIDDGEVETSNLQRQTIYTNQQIGHLKAQIAEVWVHDHDPMLDAFSVSHRLTVENARDLLAGVDLVLDGSDSFVTRLAVSDGCVALGVPLLSAAVGRFQGQIGAFAGHRSDSPCYRCYVGDAFDAEDCDSCAEDGMLGAMAGWVGSFAAMQAIRVLLDGVSALGDPQWGMVHLLDGLAPAMRSFRVAKDPACRACGGGKS